jgi:hypothetical protein
MKRRTLLTVGIATGALLTVTGATLALLKPGRKEARFTPSGRALFMAVTQTVLGPLLPLESAARSAAIDAHLTRVEATIAGLPPHMQAEVDELITIIGSSPGRVALVGLSTDWASATATQITEALQSMQRSTLSVRQQAYHALRDITNGSYFADPSTWSAIGYPGARPV